MINKIKQLITEGNEKELGRLVINQELVAMPMETAMAMAVETKELKAEVAKLVELTKALAEASACIFDKQGTEAVMTYLNPEGNTVMEQVRWGKVIGDITKLMAGMKPAIAEVIEREELRPTLAATAQKFIDSKDFLIFLSQKYNIDFGHISKLIAVFIKSPKTEQ